MAKLIPLSEKTQELIERYRALATPLDGRLAAFSATVEQQALLSYLASDELVSAELPAKTKKNLEFLLALLRAELLRDLLRSMNIQPEPRKNELNAEPKKTNLKYYLLALAGTLFAVCEGFDNITTLLGAFSVPTMATFAAGLVFSALSLLVFYGINLLQLAKNLEVKFSDAPKLLDLYLEQLEEIKNLRKKINRYKLSKLSVDELEDLIQVLSMLEQRLQALGEASKSFTEALASPNLTFAKNLLSTVAALMFFGSGFASGQSVIVFLLGLVMSTVVPTSLPVLLFSSAIGFAALSLYCYVEKQELQQLVAAWFGLDEEKIDRLANQELLAEQAEKLVDLKDKISERVELARQVEALQEQVKQNTPQKVAVLAASPSTTAQEKPDIGRNIYSFHHASQSTELEREAPDEESRLGLGAHSL